MPSPTAATIPAAPPYTVRWDELGGSPPNAAPANVRRKRPKPKRRLPPEVLTDDEVRAVMAACSPKAPTGLRNRALIALMYRGGLRVSEALSLRLKDVDPATGAVRVLFGKGGGRSVGGLEQGRAAHGPGLWLLPDAIRRRVPVVHRGSRAGTACTSRRLTP